MHACWQYHPWQEAQGKEAGEIIIIMLHHYKVNCIAAAQTSLTPSLWYSRPHSDKITQNMSYSHPFILSSLSLTMGGHISRSVSNSLSISCCNWLYYGTRGNEHHGHGSMRIERERERERESKMLQQLQAITRRDCGGERLCFVREERREEKRRGGMTAMRERHNIEMKTSSTGS